jgi:glutamate-ammonia-ligase adenylyltransferase
MKEQELLAAAMDDWAGKMEIMRSFKHAQTLKIAASELTNAFTSRESSEALTRLADVVLAEVFTQAFLYFQERMSSPLPSQFAIVVYGRLGSREMNYHSDLDLVFLHADEGVEIETETKKKLTEAEFYARLGQRMIHLLATRTAMGILYDVDTRLRPSGRAGLLVSHIDAFAAYQQQEAWVWEHQALIKARGCCGDHGLIQRFEAIRHETLARSRDPQATRVEIIKMAEKMRENRLQCPPDKFDLKLSPGGCLDIEFLAQYFVLCYSHRFPSLLSKRDTLGILHEAVARELLSEASHAILVNAYSYYQECLHHCALTRTVAHVPRDKLQHNPEQVIAIWDHYFK